MPLIKFDQVINILRQGVLAGTSFYSLGIHNVFEELIKENKLETILKVNSNEGVEALYDFLCLYEQRAEVFDKVFEKVEKVYFRNKLASVLNKSTVNLESALEIYLPWQRKSHRNELSNLSNFKNTHKACRFLDKLFGLYKSQAFMDTIVQVFPV